MIFNSIFRYKKQILIVIAIILVYGGGYWHAIKTTKPKIVKEIITEEKIVEKEIVVEKKVFVYQNQKDIKKTTTITENTDGSKVTKIIEESKEKTDSTVSEDLKSEKESSEETITKEIPRAFYPKPTSKYKLGAGIVVDASEILHQAKIDYDIKLGARIFGSFWLDASYQIESGELSAGVTYEF